MVLRLRARRGGLCWLRRSTFCCCRCSEVVHTAGEAFLHLPGQPSRTAGSGRQGKLERRRPEKTRRDQRRREKRRPGGQHSIPYSGHGCRLQKPGPVAGKLQAQHPGVFSSFFGGFSSNAHRFQEQCPSLLRPTWAARSWQRKRAVWLHAAGRGPGNTRGSVGVGPNTVHRKQGRKEKKKRRRRKGLVYWPATWVATVLALGRTRPDARL